MNRELADDEVDALRALRRRDTYDGTVAARAKIVLLCSEGHSVAEMTGATRPTAYKWVDRYEREGVDGLVDRPRPGRKPQISERVRSRIVALTKQTPPESTGLSHWSSRELATYLRREEGIAVSHHFVADLCASTVSNRTGRVRSSSPRTRTSR